MSNQIQDTSIYATKLTPEQKQNIVTDLALFKSYTDIATEYEIDPSNIRYYLQNYKDQIYSIRKKYVNKLQDVKLAHKRFRIEKLVTLLEHTEAIIVKEVSELEGKGYNLTENTRLTAIRTASQLVNQIRVEMEGNQLTVKGNISHTHQDSDLIDKALNILSGRINPTQTIE